MKFDLHCHSTASDGVLSPAQLVRRAAEQQVEVLAVTDHDTLDGLAEVRRTIADEQLPLRLVSGVEISTSWEHHEIHIVALGVDEQHPALVAFLAGQRVRREIRAQEIGVRLEKCLIGGTYEEAKALAGDGAVTRAHFARVLIARGVADN
ncbi:MAG: PHP domain-containing protein, partial [Aeromonas sp.]